MAFFPRPNQDSPIRTTSSMVKIYLGDMVHTWGKTFNWMFPLNIGFIGGYLKQEFGSDVELRLFKRPEKLIEAIKEEAPDIVGLSHYVWNLNLNQQIFKLARAANPQVLNIGGGPCLTKLNTNAEGVSPFFAKLPDLDIYVPQQGEQGAANIVRAWLENNGDVGKLGSINLPGCVTNDRRAGEVRFGGMLEGFQDLDVIPSPYLTGLLDQFFEEPFVPIIETNRSCPYRCTFCAWGITSSKLSTFSVERVLAEIDYIAHKCTRSHQLSISDANFGILDRDEIFAKKLYECHEKLGFPGHLGVQWNKTRPDRVFRVARHLPGLAEVGASMQSLHEKTLTAIKRKNLPLEDIISLSTRLNEEAGAGTEARLFSELILGLPEETVETHVEALKKMVDVGAEIFNYNLHLLPGTELESKASRESFIKRTAWRLHDGAFGIYEGEKIIEGQELVVETATMSLAELSSFRFVHFLQQFMWGRRWYFDFLNLLKQYGVHPIDFILALAQACRDGESVGGEIFREFQADHELELFASEKALAEYWADDEHFARLANGSFGKLNYIYTYKILLWRYEEFNRFLMEFTTNWLNRQTISDRSGLMARLAEVLRFTSSLRIVIGQDLTFSASKTDDFAFDILGWRESRYRDSLNPASAKYEFYLTSQHQAMLERQLDQFRVNDLVTTLRKMSENTSATQFFYQVRAVLND
jgi:radical SAM superfamily enzyme YgiQ (UPF0313 family)